MRTEWMEREVIKSENILIIPFLSDPTRHRITHVASICIFTYACSVLEVEFINLVR
jgi:hypothetical protein